ncbi:MAG: hypothetical protein VW938_08010 [Synechococcus sp.]
MGHHRFRLPLLLALPLLAPAALAEEGPQRCNDEITRLMEIRLERAQASWDKENPSTSYFQIEALYQIQVV